MGDSSAVKIVYCPPTALASTAETVHARPPALRKTPGFLSARDRQAVVGDPPARAHLPARARRRIRWTVAMCHLPRPASGYPEMQAST